MNRKQKRVIQAFINCVKSGEYSLDYAIILIEDTARYGWLSEAAKEAFYDAVTPEDEVTEDEVTEEETTIPE